MSEALKSNTTLKKLNMSRKDKRKHTKDIYQQFPFFFHFLFSSTGNVIGDTGATSLSEALKTNATLTELNLNGEDKRKKTLKRYPSTIHSFSFLFTSTGNTIGDTGAASLSEALKSNTTLIKLDLSGKDKKTTQKTSINNSLLLYHDINSQLH